MGEFTLMMLPGILLVFGTLFAMALFKIENPLFFITVIIASLICYVMGFLGMRLYAEQYHETRVTKKKEGK